MQTSIVKSPLSVLKGTAMMVSLVMWVMVWFFPAMTVGIAIAGLVLPSRLVLVAGAGSAALGGYFGYRWCTQRESSLLGIVAAGVVGLVGFASAALDLWDRVVGKG